MLGGRYNHVVGSIGSSPVASLERGLHTDAGSAGGSPVDIWARRNSKFKALLVAFWNNSRSHMKPEWPGTSSEGGQKEGERAGLMLGC